MSHAVILALALMPTSMPTLGFAVDTVVIPDQIRCDLCSIELKPEVVLGADDGDGLLADGMGNVVRDVHGTYWLWSENLPHQLWRFESPESVRILGRKGQGPGEFLGIRGVAPLANGRILVVDRSNQRLVQLSQTGEVVSETRFVLTSAGMAPPVQVAGDTMVIAAPSNAGPRLGVPLHLFDASTGEVIREVGEGVEVYDRQLTTVYQRRVVAVDGPQVLAGHQWRYQIDLFQLSTGEKSESYVRNTPWFRPVNVREVNPPRTEPAPSLVGIAVPESGQAIVMLQHPAEDWRAGYEDGRPTAHGTKARSYALIYETVIEWIDLAHGNLLASASIPGRPISFVDGGNRVAILDDRGLTPRVRIFEVVLSSGP